MAPLGFLAPQSFEGALTLFLCRLRNREQYQDFLKALNLYASEIVSKSELQQMVHDILSRYQDLMVIPLACDACPCAA